MLVCVIIIICSNTQSSLVIAIYLSYRDAAIGINYTPHTRRIIDLLQYTQHSGSCIFNYLKSFRRRQ